MNQLLVFDITFWKARGNLFATFAFSMSYFTCMNIWIPKGYSYFIAMTLVSIYWIHNSFMLVTKNNCNNIKGEFIAGNKTEIKHSNTPKAFQINCSSIWWKALLVMKEESIYVPYFTRKWNLISNPHPLWNIHLIVYSKNHFKRRVMCKLLDLLKLYCQFRWYSCNMM